MFACNLEWTHSLPQNDKRLGQLGVAVTGWQLLPVGIDRYRNAEVTVGGADTADLLLSTMGRKNLPGRYFIGAVGSETGHLRDYNFQWECSSGFVEGQHAQAAPCHSMLAREK